MEYKNRYLRSKIISEDLQNKFKTTSVAVFGCGGLGGFVIEEIARMGAFKIYAIDIDTFSETNLNRQIFCDETTIDLEKSIVARDRIKKVNSEVVVIPVNKNLFDENADKKLIDEVLSCDLIIDALDNVKNKIELEVLCEKYNKVLIHGAIENFTGQATTIYPGDKTLQKFYGNTKDIIVTDEKQKNGNTSFTPAVIASIEVSLAIKYFMGHIDKLYRNKMLIVDLLNNDFDIVDII